MKFIPIGFREVGTAILYLYIIIYNYNYNHTLIVRFILFIKIYSLSYEYYHIVS